MSDYRLDFRIGADVASLVRLIHRGVPNPDSWTFTPYSQSYFTADGVARGDGYPTASWTFEVLSQLQLDVFLGFFSSDSDASVEVGIRTNTERGAKQQTADYTVIMHRPIVGSEKDMVPHSSYPVWNNVTINFTRLT